ncbi:Hpt domain-containing protein [bacterium]|nr:Hpt domain-containing protein [bacterium]
MVENQTSETKGKGGKGCREGKKGTSLLDMDMFLDRLDGKKDLAVKLITLFLKYCVEQQDDIKRAIDDKNAGELRTSAHSFKGMLLHFCTQAADLAYKLEKMGSSSDVDKAEADKIYSDLKIIIDHIVPELDEYLQVENKKGPYTI